MLIVSHCIKVFARYQARCGALSHEQWPIVWIAKSAWIFSSCGRTHSAHSNWRAGQAHSVTLGVSGSDCVSVAICSFFKSPWNFMRSDQIKYQVMTISVLSAECRLSIWPIVNEYICLTQLNNLGFLDLDQLGLSDAVGPNALPLQIKWFETGMGILEKCIKAAWKGYGACFIFLFFFLHFLAISIYIYLYLSMCICLSMSISICIYLYMYIYLFISIYIIFISYQYLSHIDNIYLILLILISIYIYITYIYIDNAFWLPTYRPIYLSIYLSHRFALSWKWCSSSNPKPTLNQARIYNTPTWHQAYIRRS
jgi:hypothetical protein